MEDQDHDSPSTAEPDRYSRQCLFWPDGKSAQERLRLARVLVVGCGALGSRTAEELVRAGVGAIRLVDRDIVEWSNLHRQTGFEESDARHARPKAEALAARLRRVNSQATVEFHVADFNFRNALDLARDCQLLLDGTDNLPARFLINDVSYRLGVPWIYAGAIRAEGHVQLFSGKGGPCLRCQLPDLPPPGVVETCDTVGVMGPAAGAAASWQAALALRYLVEGKAEPLAGKKAILRPWRLEAKVVSVEADPRCQVCALGRLECLSGTGAERVTALCGGRTIQVLPARDGGLLSLDLGALSERLETVGTVERGEGFLRVRSGGEVTFTLFPDGRALFHGLTDASLALSLYTRWIGQ